MDPNLEEAFAYYTSSKHQYLRMIAIYKKEFLQFFGQIVGYASIALFVLLTGLYVWVFPSHSILERTILSLDPFFAWAPIFLILVVSAATMRQFAEESAEGTLELLVTKPLSATQIVLGKYFAAISIVALTLTLTAATYIPSVQALALDNVTLDYGSILGAYLGLMLFGMTFSAVGLVYIDFGAKPSGCFFAVIYDKRYGLFGF